MKNWEPLFKQLVEQRELIKEGAAKNKYWIARLDADQIVGHGDQWHYLTPKQATLTWIKAFFYVQR